MRTVAAIPAKDLENAKQRLVPVLSPDERRALARAMLEDVLEAVTAADLSSVLVVTRDPEVIALVRAFPVTVLEEPENRGHTEAVALARGFAAERGAERFLTVPGDVPQVTPQEITALAEAVPSRPGVAFVPSRSGFGTNGAVLSPPDVMALKFGEPSFPNHLFAARRRGLDPVVLRFPGLGLDIDGPEDLRALLESERQTRSWRLVRGFGIEARLGSSGP
ncbi:MAG: 2-phospho-L-lactate guanylyltransferase [Candidatus Rokubacteria bacterium]|nr:2-phospho-L-lactate guanylyltransferase [Candidatus Rokubacteria bacterium]